MKLQIDQPLKFWVDCECETTGAESTRTQVATILVQFERCGDAMRYRREDGQIGWTATPQLRSRLRDAELDALEDLEDVP